MAIPRSEWGAPVYRGPRDWPKRHVVIHHEAGPVAHPVDESQEHEVMRSIRRFHMQTRGWQDIAYNYVLFPSARMYVGRGLRGLPAAQANRNTGTSAICLIGNYDEQEVNHNQMLRLVLACNNLCVHGLRDVGGHQQFTATDCPGSKVYPHIVDLLAERSQLARYRG